MQPGAVQGIARKIVQELEKARAVQAAQLSRLLEARILHDLMVR